MRRAPVIILCLLVLLSIIGAAIFQRSRKPAPTFAEVDSFLKHQAATGGWRFYTHDAKPPRKNRHSGWWDHLLIRRYNQFQQDEYAFGHASRKAAAIVWVNRMNGAVTHVQIIRAYPLHRTGEPEPPADDPALRLIEDLEKTIYQQFPGFGPPVPPPAASP